MAKTFRKSATGNGRQVYESRHTKPSALLETGASRLASLGHRDFDAGSHGGLFDDRRLALANSCAPAADGANRWVKVISKFVSYWLGKSELLRKRLIQKIELL